jgi:hypothetical protein
VSCRPIAWGVCVVPPVSNLDHSELDPSKFLGPDRLGSAKVITTPITWGCHHS